MSIIRRNVTPCELGGGDAAVAQKCIRDDQPRSDLLRQTTESLAIVDRFAHRHNPGCIAHSDVSHSSVPGVKANCVVQCLAEFTGEAAVQLIEPPLDSG